MAILRIKRIDGRPERINSGKLNKLLLKAAYASNPHLSVKERNKVFKLTESIMKKANARFKNSLTPYDEWERWFYRNLENLDSSMYASWLTTFGKEHFSQGYYTEPSWNISGTVEEDEDDDGDDNAFKEIDNLFSADDILLETTHQRNRQLIKPSKKTRMLDTPRSIWIEWMTGLCFENFGDDQDALRNDAIKRLNYFFNKINNDILVKKTPEEWYQWFLSILPIMDRQEGLATIARRMTYGLLKSDPSAWLMNTKMAVRVKQTFSLEKKYEKEIVVSSKALVDPVWNSRTDLLISDGFPVKTLLFIYKDDKVFNSLENKLKVVFANTPFLKATVQKVISADPMLLMTETSLEKSSYCSVLPLTGDYSQVELQWNKAGNLLRSGHHVVIEANPVNEKNWFQTSYGALIKQTTDLPATLAIRLKHSHPRAERILSPTMGGDGWQVDLSDEHDTERLQRWLKASFQGRVTLEFSPTPSPNAIVIGFNLEEFILLQLTDRDEILSHLAAWIKGKNVVLHLLGLNQALKYYDEHKSKDIAGETSYKEWLIKSLMFIKDHVYTDKTKDFRFGFIANASWSSYDYLNLANINNEKSCRSVCNLIAYLKRKGIFSLTDMGMHTGAVFTLSMLEKARESGVNKITKLDEISTLHVKF